MTIGQTAVKGLQTARRDAAEVQNALDAPKTGLAAPPALVGVCAVVLIKDGVMLPAEVRDSWAVQTRDLRESLGYDTAPPLERMLIEHACLCWVRLAVMEFRLSCVVTANNTLAQVEHTEKRLTAAQKRFTRACESIARVRKLSRPNVQINVAAEGGRQLNMA